MQKFMQIKEYLLELSFLALLVKILATGAGIGEALAVISLVSSMAYAKWLAKSKIEQYDEIKSLISNLESEYRTKFEVLDQNVNHKLDSLAARMGSKDLIEKSFRKTGSNEQIQETVVNLQDASKQHKRYF